MNMLLTKVQKILDSLPEDIRIMVVQKYSIGEPSSPRVKKIVKIIESLDPEEKQELTVFCQDLLTPMPMRDGGPDTPDMMNDGK